MLFRPSAAHKWSNCALSATAETATVPEPESDPAREGTAAAWVADTVLRGDAPDCHALINQQHENGWKITVEMANHCQKYVDLVRADGGYIWAEQHVTLSHAPGPHIAGTLDSATLDADNHLRVRDLKYGMVLVEVWENPQLVIYAAALAAELARHGRRPNLVTVAIYQPRAYHHLGIYRTWTMTPDELFERARLLIEDAQACLEPFPRATPGKHCLYCSAKLGCEAFAGSTYRAALWWHDSYNHRQMTADELSEYWRFLDDATSMLKAAKSAAESEITTRMQRGEHMPGLMMKPRTGNRVWTVDAATIRLFTGIDPSNGSLVSPAELERRGAHPDFVNAMTTSPSLRPALDRMPPEFVNRMMGPAPEVPK